MTRLARGEVISGKYRIERTLAEGSATSVFQARHVDLGQPVAIKLLRAEPGIRPLAERFRGAARAAARLQGTHVCRVLDIDTHVDGAPLVVMEYLEGCHLGQELELHGPLPVPVAVRCVLEACDALGTAHAAGVIHCDLKPANLFWAMQPDGSRQIKVIGFGVQKSSAAFDPDAAALSVTSSALSSPAYMAPEQLDATQELDERADIWALGVVLYELIAGRPPFQGDSLPALVSAVLNGRQRPLSELHSGVPAALDEVVARTLRKRREQRYASMAELVAALLPFAQSEPVGARSDVRETRTGARPGAGTGARSQRGTTPREQQITRPGRGRYYGAAVAALLVAGSLAFAALRLLRAVPDSQAEVQPAAAPQPAATETVVHGSAQPPRQSAAAAAQPGAAALPSPSAASTASAATQLGAPAAAQPPAGAPTTSPGQVPPAGTLPAPNSAALQASAPRAPLPPAKPAPSAALPTPAAKSLPQSAGPGAPDGISDFGGRR